MTRHIIDQDHGATESERLKQYTRIERDGKPSDAAKTLQRRESDARSDDRRVQEYTRIDRGRSA